MDVVAWIGTLAGACTTLAFVPQVRQTLRSRDTRSISLPMYVVFVTGVGLWLAYGLMLRATPVILANAVTLVLAGTVLGLKLRYR